jgi:MFS family permease
MATYYFAALFSTCLMALMNFVQPFVLSELLHVPKAEQGALSGTLAFYGELVIIACVGTAGVLSDRYGRRTIYAAGFVVMAIAYAGYPFAGDVSQLILLRCVFGVGAACVSAMLATVIADYACEEDRGKATGTMGIMNGLGILLALFLLAKLPLILSRRGLTLATAGKTTYALVALLCLMTAAVLMRGLSRAKPAANEKRGFATLAREGLAAAKDPTVALAYASAFVSRGDLAVVGTFLTLWVSQHGMDHGMDAGKALARAGTIAGIS